MAGRLSSAIFNINSLRSPYFMSFKFTSYGRSHLIPRLSAPVRLAFKSNSDTKRASISSADYLSTTTAIEYVQWVPINRDQSLQQLSSGSENAPPSYQANHSLISCDENSPKKVLDYGAPLRRWKHRLEFFDEKKRRQSIANQVHKDKGDLSYDWRIPLEALKKYYDPEDEASRTFKPVETTLSVARPRIHQEHVDQIKPQSGWTASTFMDYVYYLTTSSVDNWARDHLYGVEGSRLDLVSCALANLFKKATKDLLSIEACHAALRFLFKRNQMSKARAVFLRMEHLHQDIQTPTINILLLGSANLKDLHNFTIILKSMLRWGFKPDAGTWHAFLVAVESREVQEVIIQSMRERNLLESPSVTKNVVSAVIRDDVTKHLSSNQSLDSFLSSLDRQYGMKWLSLYGANKLLDEVGKRKGVYEAIRLLDLLKRRGFMPNGVTLGTLLQTCRYYHDHFMVVRLLVLFEREYLVVPGQDAYNILFGLAWDRRWYNFLRVIWGFACVKGYSSGYMGTLILRSIWSEDETPPPGKRKNNNKIWKNSAGAVAVGIEPHSPSQQNPQMQSTALLNTQQNDFGQAMRKRLESMYKKDLAVFGRYQIVESLAELLLSARHLEDEWHRSGAWKAQSAEWKRENAITPTLTQNQEPALWRYAFLDEIEFED